MNYCHVPDRGDSPTRVPWCYTSPRVPPVQLTLAQGDGKNTERLCLRANVFRAGPEDELLFFLWRPAAI